MNIYFLIAGILCALLSIAHAIWGERVILKEMRSSNLGDESQIGFLITWYQISGVLFTSGVAFIVMSTLINLDLIRFTAFVLLTIIGLNFTIFLVLSAWKYRPLLKGSIPQLVLFTLLIILIILGVVL